VRPEQLRATLQSTFLLVILPLLSLFGFGCFCYAPPPSQSDSTHEDIQALIQTQDEVTAAGNVMRYSSLNDGALAATQGEAAILKQVLPDTFLGIRIPTAPGGAAPGQLQPNTQFMYTFGQGYTVIPMAQDGARSEQLRSMFPPAQGTAWVGLAISNTSALDRLLSQPVAMTDVDASLSYAINFGGDLCNGCAVQLVVCTSGKLAPLLPPAVAASARTSADGSLLCTEPVDSPIMLTDFGGNPLPGAPLVATLGVWGGQSTSPTASGVITQPLMLQHTGTTTLTFNLGTIQSARGWSYRWEDANRAPITQLAVPPKSSGPQKPPNLYVAATNVPTCTQAVDVVNVQAANTVTPSVTAHTQLYISAIPDAATCPVVDVAVRHIQQTDVVTAGNGITYTLTISNLTNAVASGIVQQTLAPAGALIGADLPGGCTLAGAVVSCQLDGIAANGASSATVVVKTNFGYAGTITSNVQAWPVAAADAAFLDNISGPLAATVQPNPNAGSIYIPQLHTGAR
jgi:hypothetical protein